MVAWGSSRRGGASRTDFKSVLRRTHGACYRRLAFEVLEQRSLLSAAAPLDPPPTIVNHQVTSDPGVQQQPSITVDPHNSKHLVLAYMDYSLVHTGYAGIGVAVSHDAGDTWQHSSIPLPAGFDQGAANPIVRFDDQGHVFTSFMAVTFLGPKAPLTNPNFDARGVPGTQSNNGIFVARSDDGGLNWHQPVAIVSHVYDGQNRVFFEVIPDLAIDTFRTLPNGQPNPNYGNQYVVWTRVYPPGQYPEAAECDRRDRYDDCRLQRWRPDLPDPIGECPGNLYPCDSVPRPFVGNIGGSCTSWLGLYGSSARHGRSRRRHLCLELFGRRLCRDALHRRRGQFRHSGS